MTGTPDSRERVLGYLRRHPLSSVSEIADALGLDWTTADYHLRELADEDRVREIRLDNRRLQAPAGRSRNLADATLVTPAQEQVLEAVREVAPASASDLARRMGRARSGLVHHLSALEDEGLVDRLPDGRAVRYVPAIPDDADHFLFVDEDGSRLRGYVHPSPWQPGPPVDGALGGCPRPPEGHLGLPEPGPAAPDPAPDDVGRWLLVRFWGRDLTPDEDYVLEIDPPDPPIDLTFTTGSDGTGEGYALEPSDLEPGPETDLRVRGPDFTPQSASPLPTEAPPVTHP